MVPLQKDLAITEISFAKQRMKFYYGNISERQFFNIFKSLEIKGDSSENFISLFESRLDAVVYRAILFLQFLPPINL